MSEVKYQGHIWINSAKIKNKIEKKSNRSIN